MRYYIMCYIIILSLLVSCSTNSYEYTKEYTKISESKFTHKSVNVISEVSGFKVSSGMTASQPLPQLALGWYWVAFIEVPVGYDLDFKKTNSSMISGEVSSTTHITLINRTNKPVKVTIKPKYYFDCCMFQFGMN